MHINLPSGCVVDARKITGVELIGLAERAEHQTGNSVATLLAQTWKETVQAGPYERLTKGGIVDGAIRQGALNWDGCLKGDLTVGLLKLRVMSVACGGIYEFPVQCEGPSCGKRYNWRINLDTQFLPKNTRLLPEESAKQFAIENRFSDVVTDAQGKSWDIAYRLQTPADDGPLADLLTKLGRTKVTPVERISSQLIDILGFAPKLRVEGKLPLAVMQVFISRLEADELELLNARMDEADCGVDMAFAARCKHCGHRTEMELPFGRTFFRQPREVLLEQGKLRASRRGPQPDKEAEEVPLDESSTSKPS